MRHILIYIIIKLDGYIIWKVWLTVLVHKKASELWGILHKIYEKFYIIPAAQDEFLGLSLPLNKKAPGLGETRGKGGAVQLITGTAKKWFSQIGITPFGAQLCYP